MKNFSKSVLAVAALVAFTAQAHNHTKAVTSATSDEVVKSPFGHCVVTEYNKEHKDCGAKPDVKPVEPTPAPQIITDTITLGAKTLFDFNKATLRPEGKAQLREFAEKVKRAEASTTIKNITNIEVAGHTDSKGSDAYNMKLSQRRANTVRTFLINEGIARSMITAVGYGESNPVAPNQINGKDNPAGRQQNRRVELKVSGTKETIKN